MNVEPGAQIDIMGALRRRGFIACSTAGGIVLAMYWIAMALPNEYSSSATLLVEPQAVNEKLVEAGAGRVDLNERLNLMTSEILSRVRLSRIIDDLELYPEESKRMTRDEIIDVMRSNISVRPVLPELTRGMDQDEIEINTFEIFFQSDNPQLAADVAQHLANDFIEEHIAGRVKTTQTSLEFISAEQDRLSAAIEDVTSRIAAVKEQSEQSLPEYLGVNQRLHERTITELRYVRRELDQSRSDQGFWEHQVIAAGQAEGNDPASSPQRRLEVLELSLSEAVSRGYTERHPDVIAMKMEITQIKEGLKRAMKENAELGAEGMAMMSFAEQSAQAEMLRAQNRVAAAESEILRLEGQLDDIQADISATPRVAEQLDALVRGHAQLSASLEGFSELRLNASVQADLERRQLGERFRILEPAIVPRKVSSPNRVLILALAVFLGLGVGIGVAVVLETTDPSYHSQRDLQSTVGIPVLAVIPSIFFDEDLEQQRRTKRLRILAATMITGFCLTGGVVTYLFVNGAPGWLTGILGGGSGEEGGGQEAANFRIAPRPLV